MTSGNRCSFWSTEGLRSAKEKVKTIKALAETVESFIDVVTEMIDDMNRTDTIRDTPTVPTTTDETPKEEGEPTEGIKDLIYLDKSDSASVVSTCNGKDLKRKTEEIK